MIITVSNHKGGVGKTTTVINLGAGLHKLGKRVLLVDVDPQYNLTTSLGITDTSSNTYAIMRGETARPVEVLPGFDVIPATLDLAGLEAEMLNKPTKWERELSRALDLLVPKYDYILLDTPPSLGLLTVNALVASNEVIVPLQAQYLALKGVIELNGIIARVKEAYNPALTLGGIVITQYDNRKVLNREVADSIRKYYTDQVFNTMIRDNVAIAEAPEQGLDIYRYAPKSNGATDYLELAKEIATR